MSESRAAEKEGVRRVASGCDAEVSLDISEDAVAQ